ncbi:type II toxin-antitoxin system RelB/DinJ family antitoxin [Enterococcus durans]|uniref:type II toxin-antitoxin system RelB/DinJ family antitoxin n=1 Tax=Enterococcus durans TaxID=53345 RepID=UPI00115AF16A|nr:type II toxin-antitoxin system RelB/DinJ family antitoxin [Enterococcus durans]MBC9722104.1 type II toxin-antitoxin system RelB/DinJ family antitoxin [Lactobacillus sp.]
MKVKNSTEKSRIQVGIDKELKENAEMILEELGLNATTAITILYKQVVARGEFPVDIKLSEEEKKRIRLQQLTKDMPVDVLDTDEKLDVWLNEA